MVDTITPRVATEITITGDCAVSGVLMTDTMTSSLSDHIQVNDNFSIRDNLWTGGNLDVIGNLTVSGTVNFSPFWVAGKLMGLLLELSRPLLHEKETRRRKLHAFVRQVIQ